MPGTQKDSICIAGAGLVGSLWSAMLAQRGYPVQVFEKRDDLRKGNADAGRSINLALSDRGWRALHSAGAADDAKEIAIPMYGRMIHDEEGNTNFLRYGKKNQAIYSISRSRLNGILMDHAEKHNNAEFFFRQPIEHIDTDNKRLHFETEKGAKSVEFDRLFGTDGAFSVVRENMMKTPRFNYSQEFIEHGYKELSIPPGSDGEWQLDKNCLHIWPRKSFMLIALPNSDGSFTVTLFLAFEKAEHSFENLNTDQEIQEFFRAQFPDAYELMPDLLKDFRENPSSSLVTIRCSPWYYKDNVCLMGDASHAIVPFFGQGMNAGFEDCTVLSNLLDTEGDKGWQHIFEKFSRERKPNADAIADMALENFVEMRDRVADEWFLMKQKLEKKIAEIYPDKWQTRYSMVTFSHIPYKEALTRSRKQEVIVEKLMQNENARHLLNDPGELEKTLEGYL